MYIRAIEANQAFGRNFFPLSQTLCPVSGPIRCKRGRTELEGGRNRKPAGTRGDKSGARERDGLEARGSAAHNVVLRPVREAGDVLRPVFRHHQDVVFAVAAGAGLAFGDGYHRLH